MDPSTTQAISHHFLLTRCWRCKRSVRTVGAVILFFLGLGGCSTIPIPPRITIPQPKLYTDDAVLKTFAERRAAIRLITTGISTDTLQERLRVKQQSQLTINMAASPPGTSTTLVTPPAPPTLSDLSSGVAFGLSSEMALRKRIALDQAITGYELFYLGETQFLDKNKQAVLLRIDLSVHKNAKLTSCQGKPQFVLMGFNVTGKANTVAIPEEDITVYSLQPEYTSVVGEESLLTSRIENYAAQASAPVQGVNVTGAGSYQRGLEEGVLSLIETPLQYAIYSDEPNAFAFVFGPRRRINKRSWIDPRRIFGETYEIQYELEAGLRTVYAIVLVPMTATVLELRTHIHQQFLGESDLPKIEEAGHGDIYKGINVTTTTKPATTPETPTTAQTTTAGRAPSPPALAAVNCPQPGKPSRASSEAATRCFSFALVPPTQEKASVTPNKLYAGADSQLYITSEDSVTADTEVFIGPFAVPKTNVTLLGRHRLKIILTSTKDLAAAIDKLQITAQSPAPSFEVTLVIPGRPAPVKIGAVTVQPLGK